MSRNLVVDHNILGWAEQRKDQLLQTYERIFRIGIGYELPQRSSDNDAALFCLKNNCDMITFDSTAYTHYFEAGIPAVRISRLNWDVKGDAPVYLIRIIG